MYQLGAMAKSYESGDYKEAKRWALGLVGGNPQLQVAWKVLGAVLKREGDLKGAESAVCRAIELKPNDHEAHFNLGNTLKDMGRLQEAIQCYKQALEISPVFSPGLCNLSIVCMLTGDYQSSLRLALQALRVMPSRDAKTVFTEVVRRLPESLLNMSLAGWFTLALSEPWARPSMISLSAAKVVTGSKTYQEALVFLDQSIAEQRTTGYSNLALDLECRLLLNALLRSGPVADLSIEAFCASLRRTLLEAAVNTLPSLERDEIPDSLYFSTAQQCYVKEYVDYLTDVEQQKITLLQRRIEHQIELCGPVPTVWIVAMACYRPLSEVAGSELLLNSTWQQEVNCLFKQQILEPKLETLLGNKIPQLGVIIDTISLEVREQYEEHPYPRWVSLPKTSTQNRLNDLIIGKFPLAEFKPLENCINPEVLVAGCGTGQHPIETARLIQNATVHAIDLSRASLAYAMRKTNELGVKSVRYYQADILNTEQIENTFDLIESVGVLHHLEDPLYGWQLLAKKLRPNGVMRIGLYSQLGRREIITLRQRIHKEGIGSTAQEIREFRRTLTETRKPDQYGWVENSVDFFSTSACRDLLFHVQEHQMNLTIIAQFLERNGFLFLGFDIDHSVTLSYRKIYPNDLAAINLTNWAQYEKIHPNTFAGMYQFWIQKTN